MPAGELEFGTQYAFTVVAVNDKGAGSAASPVSNTVVPFAAPGRPLDLRAGTVANQPGAVTVQWAPAEANGRPVTKYLVDVGGRASEVTDTRTTVTGLGNGQNVTVKVKAVNEAGPGPEATATARTVAEPRVTVTGSSSTATSATVTFTVDMRRRSGHLFGEHAGRAGEGRGVLQHHGAGPGAGHQLHVHGDGDQRRR